MLLYPIYLWMKHKIKKVGWREFFFPTKKVSSTYSAGTIRMMSDIEILQMTDQLPR